MAEETEKKDKPEVTPEEREKFVAEADRIRAETEKLHLETELLRVQNALTIREREAYSQTAENQARASFMNIRAMEEEEKERKAGDKYHHIYRFATPVDWSTVSGCMGRLSLWDRLDPECPIEIIFSSPGGSVIDGNVLFDYITDLRERHTITTTTMGMAASMAGILLQAGDIRVMHRRAWVLIHEISSFAVGKIGEMEDELEFIRRLQDKALDIFAARCAEAHKNGTAKKPLTRAQLARHWKRKDWWVSAEQCLEYGLVDKLRG